MQNGPFRLHYGPVRMPRKPAVIASYLLIIRNFFLPFHKGSARIASIPRENCSGMSRNVRVLRLTHASEQTGAKIERSREMKYILMMNGPKSGWETFMTWPKQDLQAHIAFMMNFSKK